ncbi:hypothetical protein [Erythrobacter sp. YJ-T3-07]|uniref:hypothetical protein n=1 Tax=Erythrobacter sp. YJ-T3-07 TaxID=2793063 RepID=UPI001F1F5C79|nr:hypothetical protein [Erythrobacter sp. YJ-T3-07]
MTIIAPKIIAPDSSHWAKWLDAASGSNADRRQRARDLHGQLIDQGRIPLLSWHHLEELLGGEDDAAARARVRFLQDLPLVAFLRLPKDDAGLGSIAQVLAAEATAASEGLRDLISVRDRARELLLKTGTGTQAIGEEAWVWEAVRPILRSRKGQTDQVAALGPLRTFDDSRTIGELAKGAINSRAEMGAQLDRIHAKALQQALQSTGNDSARARLMADDFVARVVAMMPPPGTTVRELLESTLVDQGVDEAEIRDECVLADLSRLAMFRNQLRVVASETGRSFEALKSVPMDVLPSRVIGDALRAHGQVRQVRPGSDLNDGYLGVLAAYCAALYVDKRTAEDFLRAQRKEPRLTGLVGEIVKAADFDALLEAG